MKVLLRLTLLILLILALSCEKIETLKVKAELPEKKSENYERQIEELKKALRGDVKIKVKRDGKGNYSWEIQGKDVNEVLRINEILKKRLSE